MTKRTNVSTKELTERVLLNDKRANHLIKLTLGLALAVIIVTLGYLVYQNAQSDKQVRKVEAEVTVLNVEQLQILTQIKTNQGVNSAIYKAEFEQVQKALQEQNLYLKCLTSQDVTTCTIPVNQ